jgi:arsenite methyltransferase
LNNSHQSVHSHDSGHTHADGSTHSHQNEGSGKLMAFLGRVAHNGETLSDYRGTRIIHASNHTVIATIAILLVGVVLAHLLPTSISGVGWVVAIVAAAHLAILVIGGLLLTLFIRHQRSTSRQLVIDSIPWRGTEQVLDVACGTGMLLNGCARKLTTGKAIGIDMWQEPVSGSPSVLMLNAKAEGVADKVEYKEMDARHLTFPDASFDVVTSSFALHHIATRPGELDQAVGEMIRVLKPGGYLALIDVDNLMKGADTIIKYAKLDVTKQQKTAFFRMITARKA